MRNLKAPQINASSMADIAFLLLIFFLVSATIPNDKGFNRKLSPECLTGNCNSPIKENNLLNIALNESKDILVQNDIVPIQDLKDLVKDFVDNNASNNCSYCKGSGDTDASDHPNKVVISLKTTAKTPYTLFIQVQDELEKAYYELRANYANEVLKKPLDELNADNIKELKKVYPFIISEAETDN